MCVGEGIVCVSLWYQVGMILLLLICVCGSFVLEVKGICWSVCTVLPFCSCMSSVVLSISSLHVSVSKLLFVLIVFACCFVSMGCFLWVVCVIW